MARRACLFMILSAAQALLLAPRIAPRLSAAAMHRQSGRTSTVHALMPLSPQTVDLGTVTAVADAAERLTDEAIRAANGELGWWGTYIKTVEDGIFTLHDFLSAQGAPYPYGLSIFLFVVGVKLVTLPLNWQQLSSAAAMKELKPQQDLVRKWYGDNKDLLNIEIGVRAAAPPPTPPLPLMRPRRPSLALQPRAPSLLLPLSLSADSAVGEPAGRLRRRRVPGASG